MRITIISGSHRVDSQSERVGRYVERELRSLGVEPHLELLSGNPLPLWDEGVWGGDAKWKGVWPPIAKQLQASEGFVLIAPEWAGMVPPGLKNFLLLCSN